MDKIEITKEFKKTITIRVMSNNRELCHTGCTYYSGAKICKQYDLKLKIDGMLTARYQKCIWDFGK